VCERESERERDRERERERERESVCVCVRLCQYLCLCVPVSSCRSVNRGGGTAGDVQTDGRMECWEGRMMMMMMKLKLKQLPFFLAVRPQTETEIRPAECTRGCATRRQAVAFLPSRSLWPRFLFRLPSLLLPSLPFPSLPFPFTLLLHAPPWTFVRVALQKQHHGGLSVCCVCVGLLCALPSLSISLCLCHKRPSFHPLPFLCWLSRLLSAGIQSSVRIQSIPSHLILILESNNPRPVCLRIVPLSFLI